jgi:hypothetical protein
MPKWNFHAPAIHGHKAANRDVIQELEYLERVFHDGEEIPELPRDWSFLNKARVRSRKL